jgi:hypothetical protein
MEDVVGFGGYYKVTEAGEIHSVRGGRLLKKSLKPNGYEYIELNVRGEVSYKRVHRLVAEAFCPNELGKPFVNHKDGNKSNNHYTNLEWVTGTENNLHAIDSGLAKVYHNLYEVTSPNGVITICVGYAGVINLSGVSKNTVYNCVKQGRPSRGGYEIKFIERATTSPEGRTHKCVETGGSSQSS